MYIISINVTSVRNLESISFYPSQNINIIYGNNGSGKTSLLESIHLLGVARSFRSNKIKTIIKNDKISCTIFCNIAITSTLIVKLGIYRNIDGTIIISIDGQHTRNKTELAEILPLQIITTNSFRFLEVMPKIRRQYIDWGVFHMEPRFLPAWKKLQKTLKQRNSWIKYQNYNGHQNYNGPLAFDYELSLISNEIDMYRKTYFKELTPVFKKILAELIYLNGLTLTYYRGWDPDSQLVDILKKNLTNDIKKGYTQFGPHKADMYINVNKIKAVDILSSGQQKLVICALKIANGYLISKHKKHKCIYLIDDFPSDLDETNIIAVVKLLETLDCQVFMTCLHPQLFKKFFHNNTKSAIFIIEDGKIEKTTLLGV